MGKPRLIGRILQWLRGRFLKPTVFVAYEGVRGVENVVFYEVRSIRERHGALWIHHRDGVDVIPVRYMRILSRRLFQTYDPVVPWWGY